MFSRTKREAKRGVQKPKQRTNKETDKLIQSAKSVIHDSDWVKREREALKKLNKKINKRKPRKKRVGKKVVFENYNTFLNSEYWSRVRKKVLKRDNHKCQKCNRKINLHVHHKTYEHHGTEHRHLEDLITLCDICHAIEHSMLD